MASIEQSVKDQFAKVFVSTDWSLFKAIAEINFGEAAVLKTSSFKSVTQVRPLLIRNIRKRLLIGIGAELLLKAVYLKSGHGINLPKDRAAGPIPPYKQTAGDHGKLDPNQTLMVGQLIDHLNKVLVLPPASAPRVMEGLKTAKVFRNKEGHTVTSSHQFDPDSYRAIEFALREVYLCAFGEQLTVHISFAHGERGVWRTAKLS